MHSADQPDLSAAAHATRAMPTSAALPESTVATFATARFLTSAHQPHQFPPPCVTEVAIAGRSNSGKSSALNTITHGKLARTSKAPGGTRLVNFFDCGNGTRLVDLPGYGYAQTSHALREHWGKIIHRYLTKRACLKGLVVTMDCRRPLLALDWQLLAFCESRALPVHILLSKSDKLSRGRAQDVLRDVRRQLASQSRISVQLFSSLTSHGREEARAHIATWFAG